MSTIDRSRRPRFALALFHPRYWLTWLGLALWWLLVQVLPFRVLMWLGGKLGLLMALVSKKRVHIARVNLALCFPEKTEQERARLLRATLESVGRGVFDTAICWFWPRWRLLRRIDIEGTELISAMLADREPVLLFTPHFTSLELSSPALTLHGIDHAAGVYRPDNNPVYDFVQSRGRERHHPDNLVVPKQDVRGMVKALREGRAMVYLPDQDYGAKHSVFASLFGIPAATLSVSSQLAKLGKATVLGYVCTRKADLSGYTVALLDGFEDYGKGSEQQDARILNQFLEQCIRRYPDQYLWVHRRFKTRPPGEADFYTDPEAIKHATVNVAKK